MRTGCQSGRTGSLELRDVIAVVLFGGSMANRSLWGGLAGGLASAPAAASWARALLGLGFVEVGLSPSASRFPSSGACSRRE